VHYECVVVGSNSLLVVANIDKKFIMIMLENIRPDGWVKV